MKILTLFLIIVGGLIAYVLLAPEPPAPVGYQPKSIEFPDGAESYPPQNAENLGEGLYSQIITPATDSRALHPLDIVEMSYEGWALETKEQFDSSRWAGKNLRYRVDFGGDRKLIEGWMRVIPKMKLGETRRIWIPKELAYGANPQHHLSNNTLIFDVTIQNVEFHTPVPSLSRYTETPDSSSVTLPSGITFQTIERSESSEKPNESDNVVVHKTIWNSEGKAYSSTESTNRKLQLSVKNSIKPLKEALLQLHVGDTARFWVPGSITPKAGMPSGFPKKDWIMDIKLLEISAPFDDPTPSTEK